jgi:hypothetical protein
MLITTTHENNPAQIFIDGGSRISFWKIAVGDRLLPMKLPARLLLAALTLSIGFLAPMPPREVSLAIVHNSNCCADMNTGGCHSCPTNTGETNSGLASTCCTSQSGCCSLYFTKATSFLTAMQLIVVIGINDEHATVRTQRPRVPPPRGVFA